MRPLLLSLYKYNEIEHSISARRKIITGKSIFTILPWLFELNFYFQPSIYFFSSGSIVRTMFDNVATLQHRFAHLLCPILFNSRYASFINQMDSDKRGYFFLIPESGFKSNLTNWAPMCVKENVWIMLSINLILLHAAWIVRSLQTMSLRLFLSPCEGLSAPSVPPALHSTQMQRHEIYIFLTKLFPESVSSLNMFTGLLNAYSLAFSLESCYPNTLKYHSTLIHPAPRFHSHERGR